jgi:hypothetical protein
MDELCHQEMIDSFDSGHGKTSARHEQNAGTNSKTAEPREKPGCDELLCFSKAIVSLGITLPSCICLECVWYGKCDFVDTISKNSRNMST